MIDHESIVYPCSSVANFFIQAKSRIHKKGKFVLVDKCGNFRYYYCMRKKTNGWLVTAALLFSLFISTPVLHSQTGFTQQDRETLIELKTTMKEIDKRFEQIDKRFEQVDKRISELREDMNKRFEQMMSFMWILATIFGGMVAVTISFALWDRRTMIRPFESKVAQLDARIDKTDAKYAKLIEVIRDYAAKDKKFAAVVERFNIL